MVFVTGGAFTLRAREFLESVPNAGSASPSTSRRSSSWCGRGHSPPLVKRAHRGAVGSAAGLLRRAGLEDEFLSAPGRVVSEGLPRGAPRSLATTRSGWPTATACTGWSGRWRPPRPACASSSAARWRSTGPSPVGFWLHVASIEGYRNLCRILTESHARHPKGQARKAESRVARNQSPASPVERSARSAAGLWCLCFPSG